MASVKHKAHEVGQVGERLGNTGSYQVFENQTQRATQFISTLDIGAFVEFATFVIRHEEPPIRIGAGCMS